MKNHTLFTLLFLSIGITFCTIKDRIHNERVIVENGIEFLIQDSIIIKTSDNAEIALLVVRNSNISKPLPTILHHTIYARHNDHLRALEAARNGYVGVISYTRGKAWSTSELTPYEYEKTDVNQVIEWITQQPWSDGTVGMKGGSYTGFTQWAATKNLHPALKTIVPAVASIPGMGLPMENNVFVNANYEWAFYVGNNKYLDTAANDRQRTWELQNKWWESGAAYEKIDSIDQRPNKWFQAWIDHPSFDEYWQSMIPFKEDFSRINIPVLTIDGYYNDSQNSGLYYLKQHYHYNSEAEHYLIIGPYGHFGAQNGGLEKINGYKVDDCALFNITETTYQWFDYILKDGMKPMILKDKINYQVMEANQWRSAPSIEEMSNDMLKLYMVGENNGDYFSLSSEKPKMRNHLRQTIDFSDRENWHNNNYYPSSIVTDELNTRRGFAFVSEPLQESMLINGSFEGEITASINKKDMDVGLTLFELKPSGEFFHLSYIIFRASYAKDITSRNLLRPHVIQNIPFSNTHLISKKLEKGSRLLVYLDINKNPFLQLNYGTDKDVSKENINDAGAPLEVKWYNYSYVEIPVFKESK